VNIQQLKYYLEICRCRSFSKAADNLYISQQGLSMAIIRLESEFSCKLFIRTPRGLRLTKDGEYFKERAERMVAEYEQCRQYFHENYSGENVVNVAGVQGAMGFKEAYPKYQVFFREYADRACDEIVENMEAEVGLGLEPLDQKKFECFPLFSLRLVLLVHKSHPLSTRKSIPTQLLQDLPMIMVDEKLKSADNFLEQCKAQGVTPKIQYRVVEAIAVHRLVQSTKGVGLSVETVAAVLNTPDTVAIPFQDERFTWVVDLFYLRGAELSEGAAAFANYMRDHVPEGKIPSAPPPGDGLDGE
jgi:DNA-binding transcriptional LysR family regulator